MKFYEHILEMLNGFKSEMLTSHEVQACSSAYYSIISVTGNKQEDGYPSCVQTFKV